MHSWKNLHFPSESYLQFFIHKPNFTVARIFEIEGNEQLQVKMAHLYFIDEVIISSVIHNDILHL